LLQIGFAEYEGDRNENDSPNQEIHDRSAKHTDVLRHACVRERLDGEAGAAEDHEEDKGCLLHNGVWLLASRRLQLFTNLSQFSHLSYGRRRVLWQCLKDVARVVGDPFEVVDDLDVDEFGVNFRIVIGHTGDGFLAELATLVVDHVFEIDGYFHIRGGYL
jgi:hypothetical protein